MNSKLPEFLICTICCQNIDSSYLNTQNVVISQTICKLFKIQEHFGFNSLYCTNCSSLISKIHKILQDLDKAKLQLDEIIIRNSAGASAAGNYILDQNSAEIARSEIIKRIKPCVNPVAVNKNLEKNEVCLNEVFHQDFNENEDTDTDYNFNFTDEDNYFEKTEKSQKDHIEARTRTLHSQLNLNWKLKTLEIKLIKLPQSLVNQLEQKDCDFKIIQDEIDRHLKKDHQNQINTKGVKSSIVKLKRKFACTKCNESFSTNKVLKEHLVLKHGSGNSIDYQNILNKNAIYQCPEEYCCSAFCTREFLTNHLSYHKKFKGKFPCTFCPSSFAFERIQQSHMKVVHNHTSDEPDPKVICEICGVVLLKKSYSTHKTYMHNKNRKFEKKKQCPICKIWLKNEIFFERHKITHKWTTSLNFPCKTCGRCFDKERNMRNHEIYAHSTVKNNICPELGCNRAYTNMFSLKNHMKTHVVGKPFNCTFEGCKKAFKQMKGLNIHIDSIHKSPDECPYECMICKEKFSRQSLLNVHRQRKNHIFLTEEEKQKMEQEVQESITI